MTTDMILQANLRTETGSAAARRLRRQGVLPASVVMLGGGSVAVALNQHDFDMILRHHTGEHLILEVNVEGKGPRKLLLAEVQRDNVSGASSHVDLHEISMTERMQVAVALELVGDSAGVRLGGILEQLIREIDIECLPSDLIESIVLDVTSLAIGDVVTVADLVVDSKLTVLTAGDVAVAHVSAPQAETTDDVEGEGEEGASGQPVVIGKKAKEGDSE